MRKVTLYFKHPKDSGISVSPAAVRVIDAIRNMILTRAPADKDEAQFIKALFLVAATGTYDEQKGKSMQELVDEYIYADTFDIAENDEELDVAIDICDRVLTRTFRITSEDERTSVVFGIFYLNIAMSMMHDQQVLQAVLKEIEEAPEGKEKLKGELLMNPASSATNPVKQRKLYVKDVKFYCMHVEPVEMPSGERHHVYSPTEQAEDMLRYDGAYCNDRFPDTVMYLVKKGLMSEPTLARWKSFGITLTSIAPPIGIHEIDQTRWFTILVDGVTKMKVSMAEEQQRRGYVYMFPAL